jgi:hypothetical protein
VTQKLRAWEYRGVVLLKVLSQALLKDEEMPVRENMTRRQ